MNFDLQTVLSKADEVLTFVQELSPEIPQYGAIINIVAGVGKAAIALEPKAVALFAQVKNTVAGGTPPTEAQLAQWAAETDQINATLSAHIQAQLKAAP